jgi:MoaA/NifB/PqqE/SkfB family radical SAM enzyme
MEFGVKAVLLAGGEPTLYVAKANKILRGLPGLSGFRVRMTTNGHFGDSLGKAIKTLKSFIRLTSVQVSYDRYHAEFLPINNIANISQACKELGIDFSVSFCVSNPLDVALVAELKKIGSFRVGIQKVLPVGAAARNLLGYKHPSFDEGVLGKKCPRIGKMMYLGGCGFSVCCSSLVLGDKKKVFSHPTLQGHMESLFYRLITGKTFKGIAKFLKVPETSLEPIHSDPCTLCSYLFLGKNAETLFT